MNHNKYTRAAIYNIIRVFRLFSTQLVSDDFRRRNRNIIYAYITLYYV
jgi:hypothetical protein